jgi:cytochrome b subunit of formate dehydrogenase
MDKTKVQYFIDIGLIISFLIVFISGIFKFYPLRNYFVKVFEIIPNELMRTLHDWSGIVMGILVLIHVGLNWRFMVIKTKEIFSNKNKEFRKSGDKSFG